MPPPVRAPRALDRRAFLRTLALGAGVATVGPGLVACGGGTGPTAPGAAPRNVAFPTYVAAGRIKPDLIGNAEGLQDGYLSGLTNRFTSVEGKPAAGGTIRAFTASFLPPPPPVGENTWWKAVNERVGAEIKLEITPAADYASKFGTVMAGNDVPDIVQIPLYLNLPRLPDLYRNRFADLTDQLSGDAIKKYPNLAAIPTYAWRNARIAGRIYGVPVPRAVFGGPLFQRTDILTTLGVNPSPKNAAEFEALCKAVTDPKAGRWALGAPLNYAIDVFAQTFGAPRNWRLEGDKLTHMFETPQWLQAIEFTRKLVAAGYFHPDSGSTTAAQVKELFAGGKVAMVVDSLQAWKAYYDNYASAVPGLKVDAMIPFAADGGTPIFHFDTGAFSVNALKKAETPRIEELLRVMNFFAAPYGSEEELLNNFGVEGVDHTKNAQGAAVLTDRGKAEQSINVVGIATGAPILYSGRFPDWVKQQYEWEKVVVPLGVSDPTLGLYSETYSRSWSQLNKAVRDATYAIIAGRAPVTDFTNTLSTFRSGGGDAMRTEFQDAIAQAGG